MFGRYYSGSVVPMKDLPVGIARWVMGLSAAVHGRFMAEFGIESVQGSPFLTGWLRSSVNTSFGSAEFVDLGPSVAYPAPTAAHFAEKSKAADGIKPGYLTLGAPHSWMIDSGRQPYVTRKGMSGSEQARTGVTTPAAHRAMARTEASAAQIEAGLLR